VSEDKDKLIVTLLQRVQSLEAELSKAKKDSEEEIGKLREQKAQSLSSLVKASREHELSSEDKEILNKVADLIIQYGKRVGI
jgi:chaperonin cofactor prefoldin